jgi:hypothetical protein
MGGAAAGGAAAGGAGAGGAGGAAGNGPNRGGSSDGGGFAAGGSASAGHSGSVEGGASCASAEAPMATGATIEVTPPATLADALSRAAPGDRVLLHAGKYGTETIKNRKFTSYVVVEAATGEDVAVPGIVFQASDHIALRGIHFEGTVQLSGASNFWLEKLVLDGPDSDDSALQFQGQDAPGACHDVTLTDSIVRGGGRSVFVLGHFQPSETWNHHLTFVGNQFTCGSRNCFQISGGRDLVIENNQIAGNGSSGILTAGATRVMIARNRFKGPGGGAVQVATPGAEWDDYAGVENMISSDIVIANNVISGFSTGVQFDAATRISVVYNTVVDGTGIRLNHRTPHSQSDEVILDGNRELKIWNNILPSITVASGETRPSFESNNAVKTGGGGTALISTDPKLDSARDYALGLSSPAIDAALSNSETPPVDFENHVRGAKPDLGARELSPEGTACP